MTIFARRELSGTSGFHILNNFQSGRCFVMMLTLGRHSACSDPATCLFCCPQRSSDMRPSLRLNSPSLSLQLNAFHPSALFARILVHAALRLAASNAVLRCSRHRCRRALATMEISSVTCRSLLLSPFLAVAVRAEDESLNRMIEVCNFKWQFQLSVSTRRTLLLPTRVQRMVATRTCGSDHHASCFFKSPAQSQST